MYDNFVLNTIISLKSGTVRTPGTLGTPGTVGTVGTPGTVGTLKNETI